MVTPVSTVTKNNSPFFWHTDEWVSFVLQILVRTKELLHKIFSDVSSCFILLTQIFTDEIKLPHSTFVLFISSPLKLFKHQIMTCVFFFITILILTYPCSPLDAFQGKHVLLVALQVIVIEWIFIFFTFLIFFSDNFCVYVAYWNFITAWRSLFSYIQIQITWYYINFWIYSNIYFWYCML